MKEIESIKKWLAAQTVEELLCLIAVLFILIGLTGGYLIGQYRESAKITQQLENHAISNIDMLQNYNYFSIDGKYIYYIVKTNITLQQYYQKTGFEKSEAYK